MKRFLIWTLPLSLAACSVTTVRRDSPARPTSRPANPLSATRPAPPPPAPAPAAPGKVTSTPVAPLAPVVSETQKALDLERQGHFVDAMKEYLNVSVSSPTPSQQESARLKAVDLLETRLNEEDLHQVADSSDFGFLRGHALFQLGEIAMDRRDTDSARRYFSSVMSFLPGSDLAFRSQEILSQLESIKYVEPKTIGVILPLSGRNASIGQKALRGVEMGLGLHEANTSFKLAVMDSEGNPDAARRGVERLVKEDNVIAIIGSLLSRTAPAVATKADELGVPTLALSQKAGITEIGPTVFRNALTSEMQVRELVRTAMNDFNMRRFAILYPNDAYGVEFANIFWDEVLARGGSITAAQTYNPKGTDFRAEAQRLVGTWYIEAREPEFKMLARERSKDPKKKSVRQEKTAEDILSPVVDFDAVFIPDSSKKMSQLAAFLSYAGVRNVKLLGTNLWNTPDLAKRAGLFANQLLFVDSAPTDSPSADGRSVRFMKDYKQMFGENPSLVELQAYDSALLLRQLISQGASSRESLTRRLTDLKRFPGVLGLLDMTPQREVGRPVVTYSTLSSPTPTPLRKAN
ncbi:MAG: penicillin-binding protein activator [Bdellovibrionaceae bacterium]|nr:penicillin-binding protein activator [Pseudobdellovibrionaceae bacterium]